MSNSVDYKFSETPGPVIEGSFEVKQQTPIQVNYPMMYLVWKYVLGLFNVFVIQIYLTFI